MSDNIKVVVKVRPLISREIEDKLSYQWRVKNNTLHQIDHTGKDVVQSFTFDKVYDENTKTSDVYNDVAKPIVEAATAGFNGTIFAYGQTSSGKTYTMSGTEDSPGIIQMAVLNLFKLIKNIPDRDFLVRVSYIEIYNETVKDLFNVEKEQIKIHETLSGIKVDVTEKVTSSPEDVLEAMKLGEVNRQTGATNMNEKSSRSHSIFQITIESREHVEGGEEESGCVNVSQLNLVDLAGSERAGQTGATGIRFKEGTHINKSLSALALVIKQLSEDPNRYANYRDSKLTRILQNSLGGNAKTSIICAVTPAAVEETISTLQFANRAKAIKNKPEVNEVATNATMIQSLTKQLSKLKTQLETKKNIEQDNFNLQKQIANLQKLILNGFGQARDVDVANSRRKNDHLRRKTISTIHTIQEEPTPVVRQFHTPILKYNPMLIPGVMEFAPIQGRTTLASLPEEPCDRAITPPPPNEKQVNFSDEIIEIDSDDDDPSDATKCSPYHKCYTASKTPPCILRKNAKVAEKSLQDILHLTEREKMYSPSTVELLEKLENNATVISRLKEEVDTLKKQSKYKDVEVEQLKTNLKKSEEEIKNMLNLKEDLEIKSKEYTSKLTDSEVSYETLKKKAKRREEELLSLLEEQVKKNNNEGATLTKKLDKEITNFMDISKEISLVESDSENSILMPNQTEQSLQLLISDLQTQITCKNNAIIELEANLNAHKQRIDYFENSSQEFQEMITTLKDKLSFIEQENLLLKSTIDTLNSTVKSQKENLEAANNDMESYISLIQELQIKLTNKDRIAPFNDSMLQNMIDNEEKFIANNENMKNIVQGFKLALDSRNKEIGVLKSNLKDHENMQNIDLREELDAKVKEIACLKDNVVKLDDQIKEHVCNINILMEDKINWTSVEKNLSSKITALTKHKEHLQTINKEKDNYIENLKEEVKNLSLNLSNEAAKQTDLFNANQNLLKQVNDMSNVDSSLENAIETNSNTIILLEKENKETQEHLHIAKAAVIKLQSILSLLTKDTQIVPENTDDFGNIISSLSSAVDLLEVIITDYTKRQDDTVKNNKELTQLLSRKHSELLEKHTELINLQQNIEELIVENKAFTQQSQESLLEMESKTNKIRNMEKQLEELKKHNEALQIEFQSKEKSPSLSLRKEEVTVTAEKIKSLQKEIDALNNLLKSKEDCFAQTLLEKEMDIKKISKNLEDVKKELSQKCSALDSMTQQITDIHTQMNQAQNDRDQLIVDILAKVNSLTKEFNIENNLSCQFIDGNVNTYEQIILTLDKIRNYINVLGIENMNSDSKRENIEEILIEAKKEIRELTKQNLELREKLCDFENKNVESSMEIQKIRIENEALNKNLITSQDLLQQLKHEVTLKAEELCIMEIKAKKWKDEFDNFDRQIKEQMGEMHIENERLKICCQHESSGTSLNNVKTQQLKDLEYLDETNTDKSTIGYLSPPSLLTICCNKIFDSIQLKDSESKSVTSTVSSTDTKLNKTHKCECEQLSINLDMVQKQCSELTLNIQHLEIENKQLRDEQEKVRAELELLLGPTIELQKKLANHKTNLSILTATTYAENKLLKSQVKVLQHHHSRFHNVCQRDLPAFKKQLQDLLVILKATYDGHDTAIKRYSLPDVLEKNTTLTNLKNESTFDGDLLMLDTNITLTTADNTLVGYDQTCLDLTQSLYNEASSQTNNLNQSAEYNIEHLKTDNQVLFEKIEFLRVENSNLQDQLNNLTISSKKSEMEARQIKMYTDSSPIEMCLNCQINKNMLTNYDKILQEKESITKELTVVKNQKDHIEQKYNNLSLEVVSLNAIVSKSNTLEKAYNENLQEITELTNIINSKNKQLKELQEENDSLSTQVMEILSELDDLSKKLQNYEHMYTELTQKCLKLEEELELVKKRTTGSGEIICHQCTIKGEAKRSRQRKSISESHTKLNRSYSDSDTSSRYNKICTLQNELHAGREDCIELTEDVTTIKNHLERSNLSMELDMTMGDPSVFTYTKDISTGSQPNTCSMPEIPEEGQSDIYSAEKIDCINYYIQNCGKANENLNQNMKIIEVMKMLYNNLVTKHSNEVENFGNKLKDMDELKNQMHEKITNLTRECSLLKAELTKKESLFKDENILIQIKHNLNLLQGELEGHDNNANIYSNALVFYKDNVLKIFDSEFKTSTVSTFEVLTNAVLMKHEKELNEVINKYNTLEKHCEKVTTVLTSVNDNLAQMECQLIDKKKEYALLKAQKDSIFEISNAVTKDILQKEREINTLILQSCQKLKEDNVIDIENIDFNKTIVDNLNLLFEQINKKIVLQLQNEKELSIQELKKCENKLQLKEAELTDLKICYNQIVENNNHIKIDLLDKDNELQTLVDLHENLKQIYENKVKENITNISLIDKLTKEIENIKETVKANEIDLLESTEKENEIISLINSLSELNEENQNLKSINEAIIKERDNYKIELEKSLAMIKQNKIEFDKMNSDIMILKESVKDSTEVVDSLKNEAKSLLAHNLELKNKFDEKCVEFSKLQLNTKTHVKTAEIQTKIISRLKKQKEEDDIALIDKDNQIEELRKKCKEVETKCESLQSIIKASNDTMDQMKKLKEYLEVRVVELESASDKRRLSIDAIADISRRRRQSLFDSKRQFEEDQIDFEVHNNVDAVFESKSKPNDLFMDVDGDFSNRSTPVRLSKGRDSLLSRTDQDEHPSRPSSVAATRRRRQSAHDMHRSVVINETRTRDTPSPCDHSSNLLQDDCVHSKSRERSINSDSEISHLKQQLASCQAELEDVRERYREVDEECEICAQYLKERDEQCQRLYNEKRNLEQQLEDLKAEISSADPKLETKRTTTNVSVNTDEDWTNLHSLVVDRMSYDAEVEKNKRLTKTIEELRFKKQELQNNMEKMQRAMQTHADLELETAKHELYTCKEELEELRERYKELDEECDICAEYLKERDVQCCKLKEAKDKLEAKLREYEDGESKVTLSVRKKRQTDHDLNRNCGPETQDAFTDTRDDLLSYQVERDDSSRKAADELHEKELEHLKLTIDKLREQKALLEQKLIAAKMTPAPTMYVATGSAIVQNQQITDVMKENYKLKKINAKLMNICKKRGKSETNRENEEPEQG
ncbi:hypothetical protein K1T71_004895 [Dendrolimus kikuchii]|uniref:Uncharacterized protein n=1 Tax=Dendrolimus kikuchii TaxID=765133 RepID=A0ACC1D5H9_9NEOP|nr:hypothetical protein K1T71_004895 [Dendrolimus kikuchii]